MAKEKQGLEVVPKKEEFSIQALMTTAVEKGVDVATMERLVALRTTMKAEMAREAFNAAMAAFQADLPTIVKTKEVKTNSGKVAYRYAPIESIVSQVKEPLRTHGFSYSTNMELLASGVKVTVKVTHTEGHSEISEMSVPLGNKTDIMSQSQVVAAAQTFAKRYAFCNAFGILTGDEDTDAAPQKEEYDTSRVPAKAKVVVHTTDHEAEPEVPEAELADPTPWRKKDPAQLAGAAKINHLRSEVKKIIDDKCLVPLLTGDEYVQYVLENTGLDLKDASEQNLTQIIERLKAL